MKKLLALLLITLGTTGLSHAQSKCYYYIEEIADSEFEVYQGTGLKKIFTNIISADCGEVTSISNEYHDALKAEYPKTYFHTGTPTVMGPFDTWRAAGKAMRKSKGKLRADGWKTIDFRFTYYGD